MFDNRAVSRERVIGISFVDILIQAVFLLFAMLLIGYVDPLELLRIREYEEAGKDLCNKLVKDSPKACREYYQGQDIGIVKPDKPKGPYDKFGEQACKLLGSNTPSECGSKIGENKAQSGGTLRPCLPTPSIVNVPVSTTWNIKSPSEIEFLNFTNEYKSYLKFKNDVQRLEKIAKIERSAQSVYSPSDIEEVFGIVREPDCFHALSIDWTCQCTKKQIREATATVWKLRELQK